MKNFISTLANNQSAGLDPSIVMLVVVLAVILFSIFLNMVVMMICLSYLIRHLKAP